MGRCGCAKGCNCAIGGGDAIGVSGFGTSESPYLTHLVLDPSPDNEAFITTGGLMVTGGPPPTPYAPPDEAFYGKANPGPTIGNDLQSGTWTPDVSFVTRIAGTAITYASSTFHFHEPSIYSLVFSWAILVNDGHLFVGTVGKGVVLRSPNNSQHRITVDNAGVLSTVPYP